MDRHATMPMHSVTDPGPQGGDAASAQHITPQVYQTLEYLRLSLSVMEARGQTVPPPRPAWQVPDESAILPSGGIPSQVKRVRREAATLLRHRPLAGPPADGLDPATLRLPHPHSPADPAGPASLTPLMAVDRPGASLPPAQLAAAPAPEPAAPADPAPPEVTTNPDLA